MPYLRSSHTPSVKLIRTIGYAILPWLQGDAQLIQINKSASVQREIWTFAVFPVSFFQIEIDLRLCSINLLCKGFLKTTRCWVLTLIVDAIHPALFCCVNRKSQHLQRVIPVSSEWYSETPWHFISREEGINHPEEWGCLFSWDPAHWSECQCIKPSAHLVRVPSRDDEWRVSPSL